MPAVLSARRRTPWTPRALAGRGLQGWWSVKRSPVTRAAGMAAAFASATSESLSLNSAVLRADGYTSWCRWYWIYETAIGTREVIFSTLLANDGMMIEKTATDVLKLSVGNGATVKTATHGSALSATTWYLAYLECDGTNIGVSLNGGALTQTAIAAPFSSGAQVAYFGADATPGNFFNGRQQCAGGINGAVLTAAQLTALYNGGTPLAADQLPFVLDAATGFQFELNEPSGVRVTSGGASLSLTDNNTVTTAAGTCLNAVSQLDDLSGNAYNATQATQAAKPTIRQRSINGFPGLSYDGTDDGMILGDVTNLRFTKDSSFTFICALKATTKALGNEQLIFKFGGGIGWRWFIDAAGFLLLQMIDTGAGQLQCKSTTFLTDAVGNIIAVTYDGTSLVAGVKQYVNGALLGNTAVVDTLAGDITRPGNNVCLGNNNQSTEYIRAKIGDFIVVNRVLTGRELSQEFRYLSREYGIGLAA